MDMDNPHDDAFYEQWAQELHNQALADEVAAREASDKYDPQ